MPSLASNLRKDLENAVKKARRVAEAGARKALDLLAVAHHEPWGSLTPEQVALRKRLRAHGRQLGDLRDAKRGTQAIGRLTAEVAYEHWHRMLFARFLAENNLLIEPESGQDITLDDCRDLAREQGQDWLPLACTFAERMLPQIFRRGDPVLEVPLPPEARSELEDLLKAQPREVFLADDSLGWVYQFWQAERKNEVNNSEKKIGADELPAVTQLFTEDYMVEFLLHNTIGAWHAARCAEVSSSTFQVSNCPTEEAARKACVLPGISWTYLRFVRDDAAPIENRESRIENPHWRPAAGTFDGWPKSAKEVRVLDPCMGSGHFLVFALPILVALRRQEEGLSLPEAIKAVLRDNLFGLEIDPRCTQIAAFNLALAAWKLGRYQPLPSLHLACSGLSVGAEKEAWLKLADRAASRSPLATDPQLFGGGGDLADNLRQHLRFGMEQLYDLFQQAPILGSLLNPRRLEGEGLLSRWDELRPLVEEALTMETNDVDASEIAVAAKGLAKAAEILASQFTLVATNVPYLGRGKQDDALKSYLDSVYSESKWDLATAFVERCNAFCAQTGTSALVTPSQWCSGDKYISFRDTQIRRTSWNIVARLGTNAFETISGEVVNVILIALSRGQPDLDRIVTTLDLSSLETSREKKAGILLDEIQSFNQLSQLKNPDNRVTFRTPSTQKLLGTLAKSTEGLSAGDGERFIFKFWEKPRGDSRWAFLQSAPEKTFLYCGLTDIVFWEDGSGEMASSKAARIRGHSAWRKPGIVVAKMNSIRASAYLGGLFAKNCAVLSTQTASACPALLEFVTSPGFDEEIQRLDGNLNTATSVFEKVPFDLPHWQKVAAEKYPHGLPKPFSSDPTQWLFNGHPARAEQPLQVAVARLLGYEWPRQTGSSFPDCPALGPDGLEKLADRDGIVCLSATKGEAPAADRLNALLATAFGSEWSSTKARELIAAAGSKAKTLADWLSDDFFEQHCDLFHQRPFIWRIWDGLKGGFSTLVNYHRLAAGDGAGRRTLEKLIYTYLGDWIDAQRKAQKAGVEGADARVTAAEHLRGQLESILAGEPPFDLFVRWKPLHEQPIGWNPDINDGVRLNIRPFMTAKPLNARGKNACILRTTPKVKWDKDRGKEPQRSKEDFPWFWSWDEATADFKGGPTFDGNRWNDCHYSNVAKQAARERHKGKKG